MEAVSQLTTINFKFNFINTMLNYSVFKMEFRKKPV